MLVINVALAIKATLFGVSTRGTFKLWGGRGGLYPNLGRDVVLGS